MVRVMKDIFVRSSYSFIAKYKNLDHYNEVKIKYGLEVMYHFITKYSTIIILAILLNLYKELLLITIFYLPLRMYGHGIHSNSNFMCWLTSIAAMLILSYYSKYLILNNTLIVISIFLGLFSFMLWAPSDTPSRPLINIRKRRSLKIKLLIVTMLYSTLCFIYKNLSPFIIISLLIETININPFIYFINHVPRNNYVGIERS